MESQVQVNAKSTVGRHQIPMLGRTFGYWSVIGPSKQIAKSNGSYYYAWLCRCICGKLQYIPGANLRGHLTKSCGCKSRSSMEDHVSHLLKQLQQPYVAQKTFDDLRGIHHGLLSYDFAILDELGDISMLVECQGRQHYMAIPYWGGQTQFHTQLIHDKRKADYAYSHDIPLLAIPYTVDTYAKICEYVKPILQVDDTTDNNVSTQRMIAN